MLSNTSRASRFLTQPRASRRPPRLRALIVAVAAIGLTGATAVPALASPYSITDLGNLGYPTTRAAAINESAQVAGTSYKELARLLGVSRAAVYQHARELGAIRIGAGERGRLLFDPAVAMRATYSRASPEAPKADKTRAGRPRVRKRGTAPARHPFLEPTAVWDGKTGLWRDTRGYPTRDQCWRSNDLRTQGLVAKGPNHEPGATHFEWEAARRESRKEHRQPVEPNVRAKPSPSQVAEPRRLHRKTRGATRSR
jgi:hypothetical protein